MKPTLSCCILTLLFFLYSFSVAAYPYTELAAPPEEIISGRLKTPQPVVTHSHSAIFPKAELEPNQLYLTAANHEPISLEKDYLLVGFPHSPFKLASYFSHYHWVKGEKISLNAYLHAEKDSPLLNVIEHATLHVLYPSGQSEQISMTDANGEGIVTGSFKALEIGEHRIRVEAKGLTPLGTPFIRTVEYTIPIEQATIQSITHAQIGKPFKTPLNHIRFPVKFFLKSTSEHFALPQKIFLSAELWGGSSDHKWSPIVWLGGMKDPKNHSVTHSIDTRWFTNNKAIFFELRNVKVSDPNSYIPLSLDARVPLKDVEKSLPYIKPSAKIINPDEEMLRGVLEYKNLPKLTTSLTSDAFTSSALLLVHGYCSGPVWPPDFKSDAKTFLSPFKNLSHDQFALEILDFAKKFSSFGIIGHSQGGLAAMHLLANYQSGLNLADGERLIQVIGAPFLGTALATNWALFGRIVGRGCGGNDSLSPDGAALWLATIPQHVREKVYYYYTSQKESDCDWITSWVLNSPNDGVVEASNAKLPGGNFAGDKKGECHVDQMKEPPQTKNKERNQMMDRLAAR